MMKNNYVTKLTLLVFTLLCSVLSWGQATLPTSFSGSLWNTGLPAGWSQTGFGADYGSNYDAIGGNAGKMDNTGDVLVINFTGTANTLSYYLGGNSLSGSYIFDVLESADGVSYTTVRSHTSLSNQIIAAPGASWSSSLLATTRYVKFIYTTKATGNVGIDGVNISFVSTNTITTNTALVGSPFCVTSSTGAAVSVPFTSVGTFNAGNVYTAQLSNAAGSFASPVSIGTVTSTLNTDVISATIPANTAAGTGYRIRVVSNNPVVTGSDNTVNLTVRNSAAISTQPSTTVQNICQGGTATALSVTATGTTLSYQWYSNTTATNSGGTTVGTNSASYTPLTTTAGTLYYYCVVTGACGSVTSNVSGAITVNAVPANPAGAITVSANPSCGPATLSYPAGSYWQTTATGTLTTMPTSSNYTLNTSGTVYVRNYNGTCWSTNSISSGAITINTPVAITTQPTDSAIYSGSNTTFSVAATGTSLSYQWQVNTGSGFTNLTNVAPYSNVTTATMNITAATVGMNGYLYRCIVSGAAPCASVTSSSALLTVTVYVPTGTVFKPGDLVFVGYDSTAHATCAGADDRFYIATLVDVLPGTQFLVVNSRYESGAAANVRTDRWYGSGSPVYEDPGILTFTWTGAGSLPAGSIISFVSNSTVPAYTSVSNVRVNDVLEPLLTAAGSYYPCNISSGDPDQIYIMQGLFTPFGVIGTDRYNTFTGRVLYGLTNGRAWVPFTSAVSAGTGGGSSRQSRLPDEIECFNIESTSLNGVRFYNNSSLHTGTKNQLLSALNTIGNWTIPANTNCLNVVEDFTGVTGAAVGKPFVITIGNPDGTWTGATDTDWFKCANWEGLSVPKATDDVIVPATPANQPIIGASPSKFPTGAFSNNLTLDSGSTLGMPNALSRLNLYANWTNNSGSANFSEGLGTVYFEGSTPQIINNVTPEGTETFHHLVLNNDFTTAVSNDIIANGNLTVGAGKTLVVSPNDYVQVTDNVTNNGTFNILNNGSLVQIDDAGVNTGNVFVKRTADLRLHDYSYWSTPVSDATGAPIFPITSVSPNTPLSVIWKWGPASPSGNAGQGMWLNTIENMVKGTGYAVRGPSGTGNATTTPLNVNFEGVPNNGVIQVDIARGSDLNAGTAGPNGVMRTIKDDNFNLIGNPYPSAIDADLFIARYGVSTSPDYADIEGSVRIWSHNSLPLGSNPDPFYANYQVNYSASDYIVYNSLGSQFGPDTYLGKIPSGQGFFVLMRDGAAGTNTINFRNALRSRTFDNSQFFRTTSVNSNNQTNTVEKHRIWLDIISPTNSVTRTVFGYATGATNELDNTFDAITDSKMSYNLYSIVNDEVLTIQGRGLPFSSDDKVQMGVAIPSAGLYKIAIATVDGIFSTSNNSGQKIYLEDKELNIIHDLTLTPYEFNGVQGKYNSRFIIRYNNGVVLANDTFDANTDVVVVSNQELSVVSTKEKIADIIVYDVLGRKLFVGNDMETNNFILPINKRNAPLFIEIVLENGTNVKKKTVY